VSPTRRVEGAWRELHANVEFGSGPGAMDLIILVLVEFGTETQISEIDPYMHVATVLLQDGQSLT